jgi:hypothetical protein
MDELLNRLKQEVGLADDKAKQVVEVINSFLKEKLPEIGTQLEGLMGKAGFVADDAREAAEGAAKDVQKAADKVVDQAGDVVENLVDKAQDMLGGILGGKKSD